MRKEDFPVSEEKLRRLAGCLRQKLSLPSEGKKAVYINLSMVRLQLAWILPKFIYAAGIAAESGCRVYVLSWRENPLLSELAESFGFQLICLNKLSFEHPLCGFRAFAKTAGFMIGDGSGDGLKELRCLGLYAGRNMYEDILRTSELSTLRSARNGLCMKKMLHILWMLYALDAQLKKAPPAYVVADDVAYHEALQLALFHKHGAKICNVSTKKEEEIRFDAKGSVIRRHQSANTRLKLIKEDPPGMEEELEGFLEDLFAGKAGRALDRGAFKGKQVFGRRELEERLGLDPEKKNAVIMAHTFSDAVYTFGELYFRDYYDWTDKTLSIAAMVGDVNWILKPHPTRAAYHESADSIEDMFARHKKDNMFLLPDDVSTESLRDLADVMITIGSNAGGQFACFGIPVIIAGKPYYSGFGYTVEPATFEEYKKTLENISGIEPLTEEQTHAARRIYYLNQKLGKPVFTDEFAQLLSGRYDRMLSDMAVSYFESNRGTKSYNDAVADAAAGWLESHDPRECAYFLRGRSLAAGEKGGT